MNKHKIHLILLFILLGCFDFFPKWTHYKNLSKALANINERAPLVSTNVSIDSPLESKLVLEYLVKKIKSQHLSLLFLQTQLLQSIHEVNVLPVTLVLSGHFLQLIAGIINLHKSPFPILIKKFAFFPQKNGNINAKIQLLVILLRIPFTDSLLVNKQDTIIFSLKEMKYVGFLKIKNSYSAVLRQPDGSIHLVNLMDVIGKEHAKIISIGEKKMDACLAGKTISLALHGYH